MEDFNIPGADRVALLERLQEAIGDVPPCFWAACQVCDLDALEKLVQVARIAPAIVLVLARESRTMVQYWSAHPPKALSQPSTPNKPTPSDLGSSPVISTPPAKKQKTSDSPGGKAASSPIQYRNQKAKALAKQRDNFRCVLTKERIIDLAHIYPFHSINQAEEDMFGQRHAFWNLLKNFWPKEKVEAWEAELFPGGLHEMGVERVYNLITLSPIAYRAWRQGAFALKPISVSNDNHNVTLKVQFFWQKKQNAQATMSLLTPPFSTKDLDQNKGDDDEASSRLFQNDTGVPIKSGQFFELQTDDPTTKPLPSFQLLEMQWFLQRVVGMAGAAGDLDWEDWDEDSDEEISNLGLDEVGDSSLVSIDPSLPASPEFLRKDNLRLPEDSKNRTEDAEGEGVRDRDGAQVIM